jgi:hypothetical protein
VLDLETTHADQEGLHLYDHYVDNGEWDNLDAILATDFEFIGPGGRFNGSEGARRFEQQAGKHLPAHYVLNTFVEPAGTDDTVRA